MDTNRIVIVGIDTVAGANIALAWADHCTVLGISSRARLTIDGVETQHLPHSRLADLAGMVADARPQAILHCGLLSENAWDLPAMHPDWHYEVDIARALVASAAVQGAQLASLVTDAVFSGPRLFHDEGSPIDASIPAAAAAHAVEAVLQTGKALIVRTHTYGWAPDGVEAGTVERFWQALSRGENCAADGRRFATPILASDLADRLLAAWRLGLTGLLHLTGAERSSPFRLAGALASAGGLRHPPTCVAIAETPATSAESISETSLNCRRARRTLETPMPMLREGLDRFVAQARQGWLDRVRPAGFGRVAREQAA